MFYLFKQPVNSYDELKLVLGKLFNTGSNEYIKKYLVGLVFGKTAYPINMYEAVCRLDGVSTADVKKHRPISTKCYAFAKAYFGMAVAYVINKIIMTQEFRSNYIEEFFGLGIKIDEMCVVYKLGELAGAVFLAIASILSGAAPPQILAFIKSNSSKKPKTNSENNNNNSLNSNNNRTNNNNNNRRGGRSRGRGRGNFYNNFGGRNYNNYNNNNNYNNFNQRRGQGAQCARLDDGFCIVHNAYCASRSQNNNNRNNN